MRVIAGAALLAGLVAPGAAAAEPWRFEAVLASEYLSKGAGRSAGEPHASVQAERDFGSGFYAGAWAGTVRSPFGADAETNLYAGFRTEAAGFTFDVRPMFKSLWGSTASETDLWEIRGEVRRRFGDKTRARLRVEHVFDGFGAAEASTWTEAQVRRTLDQKWSASATYGVRDHEIGRDYRAWSVGVERALGRRAALDVRWVDTDRDDGGRDFDGRLFAAVTARF